MRHDGADWFFVGFAELALICLVALVGPWLSVRTLSQVPVVVGELLVGLILGNTGFRIIQPADPTMSFLAEVGFGLVMFTAGTHISLRNPALLGGLRSAGLRVAGILVIGVALAFGIAYVFGNDHGPMYAVLLVSSSAGLFMPIVEGADLTGPVMSSLVAQIVLCDVGAIVLLPLAMQPGRALPATVGVLIVVAAAAAVWLLLRWVDRSGERRAVHAVSEKSHLAVEMRVVLTCLFALCALAQALKLSVMLPGFALGIAVTAVGEPRRVARQMFAISEGFLAPIFFVWLGASMNLREVAQHPQAIGLGLALGAGAIVTHASMTLTRQPWQAGVAASGQLGVPVAAAALGTSLGMLSPGEAPALLLGATITIAAVAAVSPRLKALAARQSAPAAPGKIAP